MKAMGVRLAGIALAMIGSGVMAETLPPPMGLVATHTEQQRCKGGDLKASVYSYTYLLVAKDPYSAMSNMTLLRIEGLCDGRDRLLVGQAWNVELSIDSQFNSASVNAEFLLEEYGDAGSGAASLTRVAAKWNRQGEPLQRGFDVVHQLNQSEVAINYSGLYHDASVSLKVSGDVLNMTQQATGYMGDNHKQHTIYALP